ncbi:hypothetical protein F5888DRAFT_111276 [Russula emetica]|nr:hypothetical protein F5888DRAFT_111276 [Russula emetica]
MHTQAFIILILLCPQSQPSVLQAPQTLPRPFHAHLPLDQPTLPEHLRKSKRSKAPACFFLCLVHSPQGKDADQSRHVAGRAGPPPDANSERFERRRGGHKISRQCVNTLMALVNGVGLGMQSSSLKRGLMLCRDGTRTSYIQNAVGHTVTVHAQYTLAAFTPYGFGGARPATEKWE